MPNESFEPSDESAEPTAGAQYADRLQRLSGRRWKQTLNVQAPYRWNVRRMNLGRTLDVGCGLGRNLAHLSGNGVGVDHNAESIAVARSRGFVAYTAEQFVRTGYAVPNAFDSLLAAHVVEHMNEAEAIGLLETYLKYVKPGGRICLITPQEAGYRTDQTHVRFVDFGSLARLSTELHLSMRRQYSFPFPRAVGKVFPYNEFVSLAVLPSAAQA